VLVQVKNKRERSLSVRPPCVEKTSRLGSRDPVASGVKCGRMVERTTNEVVDVSWLSLKTKDESGRCGSRVMRGDRRRLHRVLGVCSGSPENHWVTRLSHKTEAEDSMRRCGHPGRFNRLGGVVSPSGRSDHPGRSRCEASKRRTHVRITMLASSLSKVAVAGHLSNGRNLDTSEIALEGHVSLVI
jgi:hypothetical protein